MTELPKGWAETTLGEIASLRGEKVSPALVPDAPFIGLEDIEPNTSKILKVGKGSDVKSSVAKFGKGDVLYSRLRPYLNKVTFAEFDGIASAEILVLQPTDATEGEFVRRRIMTQEFLDFAAMLDKGDRPRVNYREISELPISLPPLPEQKRIVVKVDGLTARTARARTDLARIPTLIARYKQRLLALAFSGELTGGWRDKQVEPLTTRLKSVRATRKTDKRLSRRKRYALEPDFALPSTWDWISPDEVVADAKYSIGIGPFGSNLVRTDYRESGVRLVFVRDIRRERFDDDNARFIDPIKAKELHQHLARPGDVLITKMGDPPGDSALFPDDEKPAVITADCIKMTPHADLVEASFLNYCIRSPQVQSQFKAITAGVAQQKVSLDRFRQLALPVAPLAEQAEVVRRIESAFNWLDRVAADHAAASKLLPKLDAAILAKAFRGELVPQDPNDVPASMLLEQIRAERAAAPKQARSRKPRTLAPQEIAILPHSDNEFFEVIPKTPGASAMTKSRQDDDVMDQPYLAGLLKKGSVGTAQDLFMASDLPVADFYKQLAWEIEHKHIRDDDEKLEAL